MSNNRCRFYEMCPTRQINQPCCEDENRISNYYGLGSPGGCYRKMVETERYYETKYGNPDRFF